MRAPPRAWRCGTRLRPRTAAAGPAGRRGRTRCALRRAPSRWPARGRRAVRAHPRGQARQQRERRLELRELLGGRTEHRAQPVDELDATSVEQAVDRALGAASLALGLLGLDHPGALERLHDGVERAVVELDALVLPALAHRRRHLVRVHGALLQAGEHGERERICAFGLRHGILVAEYTSAARLQAVCCRPADMPPEGVGGTGRPPCARSGPAAFMGCGIPHETAAACRDSSGRPGGGTGGRRDRVRRRPARPGLQRRRAARRHERAGPRLVDAVPAHPRGRAGRRPHRRGGRARRRDDARALQRQRHARHDLRDGRLRLGALRRHADQPAGRARRPPHSRSIPPATCSRPASAPRSRCSSRASRRRAP